MNELFSSITLEKDIPVPLYYQLKKQLLSLIEQGLLKEGDKLPPEKELCEQLEISRPTVRQAFGDLSSEGYLHRFKGNGTFVSAPKVSAKFFNQLETFNNEMKQKGKIPKTQVLALDRTSGTPKANDMLGLPIDAPLIHLKRLRFADDVPLVYLDTYLPYKQYSGLLDIDFETTSLYDALEQGFGTYVSRVSRDIEAVTARKNEASLLQCSQDQALMLVQSLAFATGKDEPVEYSIARYRGDINKFSVEVFR